MFYMGGKGKVADELLPIIQGYVDRSESGVYIEPFCGGCSIIRDIVATTRIASDINPYLIALYKQVQRSVRFDARRGWFVDWSAFGRIRTELSQSVYKEILSDVRLGTGSRFTDYEIGYVLFLCSYCNVVMSSFEAGREDMLRESLERDFTQSYNDCLRGVFFRCGSYDVFPYPTGSVIYCDPPYRNADGYRIARDFDFERFYKWCRDLRNAGYTVLVSEAADLTDVGFKEVWRQVRVGSVHGTRKGQKVTIERLFEV